MTPLNHLWFILLFFKDIVTIHDKDIEVVPLSALFCFLFNF